MTTARTNRTLLRHAAATALALLLATLAAAPGAGAKPAPKHTSWVPHMKRTIAPNRLTRHGLQVATWYGPGFFGRRTACGQTLRRDTWGIAHRTLPCGTLVTISRGRRSITVPVIDRGPFSGATVDLTSRTKQYLRFVSGPVGMTEVRRFRYLPPRAA